jgi:hypothetical protein
MEIRQAGIFKAWDSPALVIGGVEDPRFFVRCSSSVREIPIETIGQILAQPP